MQLFIKEETQLHSGIFWIKDLNEIDNNDLYFTVDCSSSGEKLYGDISYNSKNGETYNHKTTWSQLPKTQTENKPFDYYPRGRVVISNGVATIYCSPHIYGDELEGWVKSKFNLTSANGIKKIRMLADNSEHYKCFLDR